MTRLITPPRLVLVFAATALVAASLAAAAPIGTLKQFRIPTANSSPKSMTQGSDGNLWFTEGFVNPPQQDVHNVARITPAGDITEFAVCTFCFPNEIAQGPNGILYFTKSDPALGRITTSGQVLPDIAMPNSLANGNGIAAHGDDVWVADFNNNTIWRYNVPSGQFTQFAVPTPAADPYDVAVDASGIVWFSEFHANRVGRIDPQSGVVTETVVTGNPRQIAVGADGTVWFTERFTNAIGHLEPVTGGVTEFSLAAGAGPEGIAGAPDGSAWFTQSNAGNIARITAAGAITEARVVRGSEPFGITVAADGNPWYTELSANKIAVLQLR
jgi:streptogramin lyase